MSCAFYLGTHEPGWLKRSPVPLFVSRRRLARCVQLPRAVGPWALDSGGFTELQLYGRWTVSPRDYVAEVRRYAQEIGGLQWAAPQDWMCEPVVIQGGQVGPVSFAGTGLSVEEHQRRTVENLLELRQLAPEVPWAPVLQGWERDDYRRCWALYDAAGVDLEREPVVGVGSVCRREYSEQALAIFESLRPLRLHGFGLKLRGLERSAHLLTSADSMAWSFGAARRGHLCGHPHVRGGKSCANCYTWAMMWRASVVQKLGGPRQQSLLLHLDKSRRAA